MYAVLFSLLLLAASPAVYAAGEAAAPPAPPGQSAGFKSFTRRPPVLSQAAFDRLKSGVMERCHVTPETAPEKLPWYFHYQLGLELAQKGDPQRALDALIEAVDRKPEPQRSARLYGMWFKDYLPYLEIAKVHAALGNWQCVNDALKLSTDTREVGDGDREQRDLLDLQAEAAAHLKKKR